MAAFSLDLRYVRFFQNITFRYDMSLCTIIWHYYLLCPIKTKNIPKINEQKKTTIHFDSLLWELSFTLM